ncbi:hypothetical protein TIFTF001_044177 [Ficus carica]|uniref:Uncharacterized protein n=1 Tax=Ficus carica TaxID=3494 RepID=A0AA87Z8C2_FICCA|nr:hypothetical protein TIFTF001_044177 [Ficus carica]
MYALLFWLTEPSIILSNTKKHKKWILFDQRSSPLVKLQNPPDHFCYKLNVDASISSSMMIIGAGDSEGRLLRSWQQKSSSHHGGHEGISSLLQDRIGYPPHAEDISGLTAISGLIQDQIGSPLRMKEIGATDDLIYPPRSDIVVDRQLRVDQWLHGGDPTSVAMQRSW